jgi:4-amino-4-deoxy-L-arabinose transferase-like glycosyltransferase
MLATMIAVGFLVRLGVALFFTGAIESEGAEYARIARNLLEGDGYVGMATPGTQLFFPPLFPFAIAALSLATGDVELAGRALSTVFGALTGLPVFWIAQTLYGRRAGLVATALVLFHPYFVVLSATVFIEPLYVAFILAAVWLAMCAAARPTRAMFAGAGAAFGLSYLLRFEALGVMVVCLAAATAYLVAAREISIAVLLRRFVVAVVAFGALAAPYAAWLSLQAGEFRIEAKSTLNIETGRRLEAGEPADVVSFGVDEDLNERGVWNQTNADVIHSFSMTWGELVSYLKGRAGPATNRAIGTLTRDRGIGSPALFVLAALGFFALPWKRMMAAQQAMLLGLCGLSVIATVFIYYADVRFYAVAIAVFCIWAAAGAEHTAKWAAGTAAGIGLPRFTQPAAPFSMAAATMVVVFVLAGPTAKDALMSMRASRPLQTAGEWLRMQSNGPMLVADSSAFVAFHAGADHVWLPPTDEQTAVRYLEQRQADYLVLQPLASTVRPEYLAGWIDNGFPDRRARVVHKVDAGGLAQITIYALDW